MKSSRRDFFKIGSLATAGLIIKGGGVQKKFLASSLTEKRNSTELMIPGPFEPTEESLKQYKCPEWFRDAKFGIWAVWGPESVPEQGDWYARHLYEENHAHYKYHLEHFGHPSKVGFKDVIPRWKGENWNPDHLMKLYKDAGAKYFCMIAQHHDNFDCFDSKYNIWNSVMMGPKRDIAGEWKRAAKKHGLRFGMTEHLAASWWFYATAKGADTKGPMKGIPYDGADKSFYDLYWKGNESIAGRYYIPDAPDFVKKIWFQRVNSIIEKYHPDLLYSDSPLPYPNEYGRLMLTNLYNDSMVRNKGNLEVIYNCKEDSLGKWVQDLERGVMKDISPFPWQTDTCVGDWYYKKSLFQNHKYKSSTTIIHMLADIVSKNGNLLLNFPPKPDGTLDDDELKVLEELGLWMPINGEAIFGTRPWTVYGEGASIIEGGAFNEGGLTYNTSEVRFTTKEGVLYVIALGWPSSGKIVVNSLSNSIGNIGKISLLGHRGEIKWGQSDKELVIDLPGDKPCDHAYSFKVEGLKIS